jgi:lipopolysaccharide export system protein LptA
MIARYIEKQDKEVFTTVELFENVKIEFEDEVFRGNHAIYTRDDNIIKLTGDVSIESPTRLLTGYELIADIDNNKRILNSANDESLVEVLLDNNANN